MTDDDAVKRREKLQALREKRKSLDAGGESNAPARAGSQEGRDRLLKLLAERRRQDEGGGGGGGGLGAAPRGGGGGGGGGGGRQFPKLREMMAQRNQGQSAGNEPKPAVDESAYRAHLEVRLGKLEATLDEILKYLEETRDAKANAEETVVVQVAKAVIEPKGE